MRIAALIIAILLVPVAAQAQHDPRFPRGKVLTRSEQAQVREFLRGKISEKMTPAVNDYTGPYDRGTVEFNPALRANGKLQERNYSYTKVIIPAGTTVTGVNFTQKEPNTNAISGGNLTFVDCQMINVRINPSWTLIRSTAIQRKRIILSSTPLDAQRTTLLISSQIFDNATQQYKEISQHEEVIDNDSLTDYELFFNAN